MKDLTTEELLTMIQALMAELTVTFGAAIKGLPQQRKEDLATLLLNANALMMKARRYGLVPPAGTPFDYTHLLKHAMGDVADDMTDMLSRGVIEKFNDPKGVERVRPTPAGARMMGDEALAHALEVCQSGRHEPFGRAGNCACGNPPC